MRALVTGASSGIGAAVAEALAGPEAELHLVARRPEPLHRVAERVGGVAHVADLAVDAELDALPGALPEAGLDVLVHSAGAVTLGPVAELDVRDWDRQQALNARVPFRLTQALLPRLREARGLVVMINSGAGLSAKPEWGGYAASKFALRALADSLRAEEAARGVRVTSVYPGRTATPMQADVHAQEGAAYDPSRFVAPTEVARVVATVVALEPPATVPDVSVRPG